eukprot:7758026-Karenia_brevis.AAC.1
MLRSQYDKVVSRLEKLEKNYDIDSKKVSYGVNPGYDAAPNTTIVKINATASVCPSAVKDCIGELIEELELTSTDWAIVADDDAPS